MIMRQSQVVHAVFSSSKFQGNGTYHDFSKAALDISWMKAIRRSGDPLSAPSSTFQFRPPLLSTTSQQKHQSLAAEREEICFMFQIAFCRLGHKCILLNNRWDVTFHKWRKLDFNYDINLPNHVDVPRQDLMIIAVLVSYTTQRSHAQGPVRLHSMLFPLL